MSVCASFPVSSASRPVFSIFCPVSNFVSVEKHFCFASSPKRLVIVFYRLRTSFLTSTSLSSRSLVICIPAQVLNRCAAFNLDSIVCRVPAKKGVSEKVRSAKESEGVEEREERREGERGVEVPSDS